MSAVVFSYVLPLVHVLACVFLIVVVLLQTGKGAEMGAVLGGGSQTLFGASGAGNLLTKLTTGMAITFMATSLLLVIGQRQRPSSTLLDRLPQTPPPATAPEVPPPAAPDAPSPEAATPPAAPSAANEATAPATPPAAGGLVPHVVPRAAEPAPQANANPADAAAPATPPPPAAPAAPAPAAP